MRGPANSAIVSVAIALTLVACGGDSAEQDAPPTQRAASEPQSAPVTPSTTSNTETDSSGGEAAYEHSIILTRPDGVNQITWEDLMPEGEEVKLQQMYEDYYLDLERQMRGQSQRLQDSGGTGDPFDVSSMVAEGSASDTMEQIGTFNVVEELDGLEVRIPGYVVPIDFKSDNTYDEFLLVPYFGACLHTPPPPPNQIVFVKANPATEIKSIYDPVWVEGTMKTGRFDSETANSAYELTLSKIEVYEY